MTLHTFHPDTHVHGLADNCPRCAEHAEHPYQSLDAANIMALEERVIGNGPARSKNEDRAMDLVARKLTGTHWL